MQKYGILKFLISLLMIILIMQFSLASFYNVFAESNTEIAQHDKTLQKLGIDSSQNGKGDVWFRISVSNDGIEWKELYKSEPITSNQSAYAVDIDISNYKYLRLYADQNGNNGNDHSVFGDARLVKRDYDLNSELYQGVHRLEYYDEIISKNNADYNYENNLKLVLEREFVNRVGFWTIQDAVSKNILVKNNKIACIH